MLQLTYRVWLRRECSSRDSRSHAPVETRSKCDMSTDVHNLYSSQRSSLRYKKLLASVMDNWNSQSGDIESVDQVYQLLLEIARSSLSDIPRIPENITQKSLPLLQKLQSIQQRRQGQAFKSDSFSVNDLE